MPSISLPSPAAHARPTGCLVSDSDVSEEADADARYLWWVRLVTRLSAARGVVGGVVLFAAALPAASGGQAVQMLFFLPPFLGFVGYLMGMSVMCLLAPRRFLGGPTGGEWMRRIGTQNVMVARVACVLFTLVGLGVEGVFLLPLVRQFFP